MYIFRLQFHIERKKDYEKTDRLMYFFSDHFYEYLNSFKNMSCKLVEPFIIQISSVFEL